MPGGNHDSKDRVKFHTTQPTEVSREIRPSTIEKGSELLLFTDCKMMSSETEQF